MQYIEANWLLIVLVLVVAALIAWYIFHAARRTRVTGDRRDVLDEGAAPAARNHALIDAPTSTAPQVPVPPLTMTGLARVGETVEAAAPDKQYSLATATGNDVNDLTRLKGVGPKLAAQLGDLGIASFAQIAAWTDADIDRVDAQLGRFQGRIRRDGWVEQARFLAAGDTAGFAARFGAIT